MKHTAKIFSCACVVYVAMAACSGPVTYNIGTPNPEHDSGLINDALAVLDTLTDPVADANAAPPDIATESCSIVTTSGQNVYLWAEHIYPGKTKNELVSVHISGHFTPKALADQLGMVPAGYTDSLGPLIVGTGYAQAQIKDGAVAVYCGVASNPQFNLVTFVLQ